MTPKLPRLTAKELVKVLKKHGFYEYHQTGSHLILKHPSNNSRVSVPMHSGKILKLGTLKSILEQAGISIEDIV